MYHKRSYIPTRAASSFRHINISEGKPRGVPLVVTFSGDELSDVVSCDRCGAAVELDGDALLRHARRRHCADDVAVLLIEPVEWCASGGHS